AYWPDTTYRADLVIDSIRLIHRNQRDRLYRNTLHAEAGPRQVTAAVRSGDLKLDFNAPVPIDSLWGSIGGLRAEVDRQIEAHRLDMERV
ncbi:MAG: hypothetical protein LUD68_03365, partial [Rikenellaceae bacterium]|nr:hypothetical protein [Rikenellaceae bacterium]